MTDSIEQLRRAAEKNQQFHWSSLVLELIEELEEAYNIIENLREHIAGEVW